MADWLNLEGKVVIVTGGASGIGNHVVSTLKDAGATPVIADISVETGEERDGIFCTKCDVTSWMRSPSTSCSTSTSRA